MNERIVCFAGHRFDWQNIGVEERLEKVLVDLIKKGYTVFYDGGKGYFDEISARMVIQLKRKYPYIKIYKILTYYSEKYRISDNYDGSIMPEIEHYHPKLKILKKNQWIVENCDILICHIYQTHRSGAYRTVKYAQKINKQIIYI